MRYPSAAAVDTYSQDRWKEITEHPDLRFFNWGNMHGSQYVTIDPVEVDTFFLQAVKEATEACGHIYQKAVKFVLREKRLIDLLGIPRQVKDICNLHYDGKNPVTVIGRFDFAVDGRGGIKLLEFNSDTPTGVVEAAELNGLIARLNQKKDPNGMLIGNLRQAFRDFIGNREYKNVVFTALDWHIEDKGTTLAEMEYSGLSARYVPLDRLTVSDEGLIDDLGRKIDLLYRLYPVEWFALEEEGVKLVNHVACGLLDIINPPSAFFAQSKVMQAVIWELASNTSYFNSEEKETVLRYFLPTYLEESYFKGRPYVTKPAYGREGGGVVLYNSKGSPDVLGNCREYQKDIIYQERINLPSLTVKTNADSYTGRLLVGSFLAGGVFSGIFLRVGDEITGNMSYFVPVVCL